MSSSRKNVIRSAGFHRDEDIILCQAVLNISQDPIVGRYQSRDSYWSRIVEEHNKSMPDSEARTKKSLQCRMQTIEKAIKKLKACIRQIENTNPSGASEHDILERAKRLLEEDKDYIKGFKFDHVWDMLKDFEKFNDNVKKVRQDSGKRHSNYVSSESENVTSEPNTPGSQGMSSFSLNLNDDDNDVGTFSCERPIGAKKAKLKKKIEEKNKCDYNKVTEQNEKLMKMMERSELDRQRYFAMKEQRREDKILAMNLNILDPNVRAHIQAEQAIILQKRAEQYQQSQPPSTNVFGQFLGDFGGNGSNNFGDGSGNYGGDGSDNYGGDGSGNYGGDGSGIPEY